MKARTVISPRREAAPEQQRSSRRASSPAARGAGTLLLQRCACGGSCPRCRAEDELSVQPKLHVNRPGDRYEQEADRVAEQVMGLRAQTPAPLPVTPLVQRAAGDSVMTAPPAVDAALATPGRPLEGATRQFMEARFGHDFAAVRVHADAQAASSAAAVGARAFTVGRDVVFGTGEYAPGTAEGRHLLAHELTHVVQQKAAHGRSPQSHVLAREPATPEPSEQDRLEKLEKVQTASLVDQKWRAIFGGQLASYREAVWRITFGLDEAQRHFEEANIDQAEFDTLVTQLFIAATSIGVAAGFQPLFEAFGPALGKNVDEIVEYLENPVVQAVGSTADIVGPVADVWESSKPAPPSHGPAGGPVGSPESALEALSSSPVAYLSTNMETIENYQRRIEAAFQKRAETLLSPTDEQIRNFDQEAREARYAHFLENMQQTCKGVEDMKSKEEVAVILERHLWAIWIRQRNFHTVTERRTTDQSVYRVYGVPDLGSYIAAALWNVGFGSTVLPEVKLGTRWYVPHEPENWADLLRDWARTYDESIAR